MALVRVGLVTHMQIRTHAIDDAVRESAERGVDQIVLLGAGLDTRAWRLDATRGMTVFEVDHPATQAFKRRRIGAQPALAREVVFVGADFEKGDLEDRLARATHDASRASLWIWEGVTPYLTPAAIDAMLAIIGGRSARGSALAMTYGTPALLERPRVAYPFVRPAFRMLGEPLRGLMSRDAARAAVTKHGLSPSSDETILELAKRLGLPKPWPAIAEHLLIALHCR
jgi:methyltransferase (TIGR00027 family)